MEKKVEMTEKRKEYIKKLNGKSSYENMLDNTEEIDKLKEENITLKERLAKIEKELGL